MVVALMFFSLLVGWDGVLGDGLVRKGLGYDLSYDLRYDLRASVEGGVKGGGNASKVAYFLAKGIEDASRFYGVPAHVLWILGKIESNFNVRAVNRNRDGSWDLGPFQINERNLRRLRISREYAFHPYWSAFIAAYILKECYLKYGNSWKTIDCYNKGDRARENSAYVWRFYKTYERVYLQNYYKRSFVN